MMLIKKTVTSLLTVIKDSDFVNCVSSRRGKDLEELDHDHDGLYNIWKRYLENAKALLKDMEKEDFVTWIKQKKNRDLVNMELDQKRIKKCL